MLAFNITTGAFELVSHYEKDADDYAVHKPRRPPYQCQAFKPRSLWVKETDSYVFWIHTHKGKPHYFVYRFGPTEDKIDIGETINDFIFSKTVYDAAHSAVDATALPPAPTAAPTVAAIQSDEADAASAPNAAAPAASTPAITEVAIPALPDSAAAMETATAVAGEESSVEDARQRASQLKKDLEYEKQLVAEKQAEVDALVLRHKKYQKRKQDEVRQLQSLSPEEFKRVCQEKEEAQATADASSTQLKTVQADLVATKEKLTTLQEGIAPSAMEESHRVSPANGYRELIAMVTDKFKAVIDDCQTRTHTRIFEFNDNGQMIRVTDRAASKALTMLLPGQPGVTPNATVDYIINGSSYSAKLVPGSTTDIEQQNTHTMVKRTVTTRVDAASSQSLMLESLFGDDCLIDFDTLTIKKMLGDYRFDGAQKIEMYAPLAEFGDVMAQISGLPYRYTTDGDAPSSKSAAHFVSHVDVATGKNFNTELLVKPFALHNWLRLAEARGVQHLRVVCHGAAQAGIDGIRRDFMGFDMTMAGKSGQAFGNGVYTGLSPHATTHYNTSAYPAGSYILALLLVQPEQGWQHRHRRVNNHFTSRLDTSAAAEYTPAENMVGQLYRTMKFMEPNHMDNAVVIHSPDYVLPIGIMRSFDAQTGWVKGDKDKA